jgi:GNAT superfamily N-acetyltransferase
MPLVALKLTIDEFHLLPRNAAYKYEYFDDTAWLNPRPRYYHALLDLPATFEGAADVSLRGVAADDWEELEEVFAEAFRIQQPFAGLSPVARRMAAHKCLTRTRTGGDGPWIEQASFVATDDEGMLGAVFVTLLPRRDPTDWDGYTWDEPPPPNAIEQRLGRPHLTWIFVRQVLAGHGIGTALLSAATAALVSLGYTDLLSTFLAGNDSSMLWHWRAGFRLLAHPGSRRRL